MSVTQRNLHRFTYNSTISTQTALYIGYIYIYIAHINKYISRYNVIYIHYIKKRKDSIKKLQEPTEDLNEGV